MLFTTGRLSSIRSSQTSHMTLENLVALAKEQGASDLHIEAGLPPALRVRGTLRTLSDPLAAKDSLEMAREIIAPEQWPVFLERRSYDLSRNIHGVRCRINVLHSARGVGLAVRLLASFQATLDKLNLHPDLKRFVAQDHGLVILSGPTGCGKSTTMAALIQEINLQEARHIVTIESPIEYTFRPRRSFIRQREVGRDTPSFDQALIDALREDPDVLMVGEMREAETMRLTLNAAETGHLVLATMHSSTCAEALQRFASAFSSEIQHVVRAQLADCLVGVISQRLTYRADLKIRIPECEILCPTNAVKNFIRTGDLHKVATSMETGAEHGMWTYYRYQTWLNSRKTWYTPAQDEAPDSDADDAGFVPLPPRLPAGPKPVPKAVPALSKLAPTEPAPGNKSGGPIEIEPVEGGLSALIKKLEGQ